MVSGSGSRSSRKISTARARAVRRGTPPLTTAVSITWNPTVIEGLNVAAALCARYATRRPRRARSSPGAISDSALPNSRTCPPETRRPGLQ